MCRSRILVVVAALALTLSACADLPGAVRPVSQSYAPSVSSPVVRARVCGRNDVALPDGWRLPAAAEVGEGWRAADRERFLLTDLDLDGDGHPDQARVLMRIDGAGYGVFAFLCREHDAPVAHLILHNRDLAYFRGVGIRPVQPGLYRTACGKGFIECYAGEPHEVRLAHAGIDYFKPESITSLFYWSEASQDFKWVALTK
ncbi:MAG TPA: hypothetical protein VGK30_12650 [Candidatus Binatia bacterium]